MRRIRHGVVAVVVCAALTVLFAVAPERALAQVIQQVPSDALVVLKVKDVKATSDKVARLAQDLGIAAMVPDMADPLAMLQTKLKIQQGFNTSGEMAFVFMDPDKFGGDPEDAMMVLVPVSDYKAFLGNWADAKTEGDVTQVSMPDSPKPGYIANWGAYAALAPSKAIVEKKPAAAGIKLPASTAKEMAAEDIVLVANGPALRVKLLPKVQEGRGEVINKAEEGLKDNPQVAKFAPVIRAIINQAFNVAEGFLKDSQASILGITLTPEGINTTMMSEFEPGSYAAQQFSAMKNSSETMLAGLPEAKYLIFGGGVSNPQVVSKVFADLADPIVKELGGAGPEAKAVQDYVDATKAYMAAQQGQNFGVLAPSGAVGAEPIIQFVSVQSGKPEQMQAAYSKMMSAQQDAMKAFNLPGAANVTLTPNAKTVDGVSFSQIVTKIEMDAQNPMAMQQAQMMNMMYGPQGMIVNLGTVGDKLLVASGVSDQVISSLITAAKSGSAPLSESDRVKQVSAQLPKQRLGVCYIPVDDVATTVLSYAKQFGFNMPVQLPPDLPPVGVTVSTEGSAARVDTHVPTKLVQSLVAAGMQAAMQMQGGGPGGGGL
jgi:hypothetical protein